MRRILAVSALAIGVVTGVSAQSLDDVIATVGDTDITLGQLLVARTRLPAQFQQMPSDALYQGLVDQLVQQQLLSETVTPDAAMQAAITNETRAIRAGAALDEVIIANVTDDAIQAVYEAEYANTSGGAEYNAAHILVETQDEAAALVEEARNGADFAELAREHSTGPSGPSGGDLGWFSKGMMVPAFETAVMEMAAGDISAPVETQFGWHVIKLNEMRDKAAPTLDEVRPEIVQSLQNKAIEARIAELEAATKVTYADGIDPSVIDALNLLEK